MCWSKVFREENASTVEYFYSLPTYMFFWFCSIGGLNDEILYTTCNYQSFSFCSERHIDHSVNSKDKLKKNAVNICMMPFDCIIINAKLIQSSPSFMKHHQSNQKNNNLPT